MPFDDAGVVGREDLEAVRRVAIAAGQAILAIYEDPARWAVQEKSDASPLTAADLAAHDVIAEGLRQLAPTIALLSEESAEDELSQRATWPSCWVVDPLDGTREFLARNGEFSVNIAWVRGGRAVLGVVHGPVTGISYVAAEGLGAWRVAASDAGGVAAEAVWQPVRVAPLPQPGERPLHLTVSRRHGLEQLQVFETALQEVWGMVESVPAGSAFKICAVAEGLADAYPRFGPTSEWDTAAAQVVLEQAGGHLVDLHGRPFRYNERDTLLNGHFLAVGSEPARWLSMLPVV